MIASESALSIREQCRLLSIPRSSFYYKPIGESAENLVVMRQMDEYYLQRPTAGVLQMQDHLLEKGYKVNHKRIRRLLRLMGLMAIYPKKLLSQLGEKKYIRPYLLENLHIDRPNQVWAIDITYIPMKEGFMYLTAIMDVYSRFVIGWTISNTLAAEVPLGLVKDCIVQYGQPQIINSDQGSQFTCQGWVEYLEQQQIKVSMDGKGRALDNIFIERLWRTVKYEYLYLNPAQNGWELYQGLKEYFIFYNQHRTHQGINRQKPCDIYYKKAA